MRRLWYRFKRWNSQRIVHCHFCGTTSDGLRVDTAERVARNHARFTGHANVRTYRRKPA